MPGHVGLALVAAAVLVVTAGTGRRVAAGVTLLVLLASAPDVDLLLVGIQHRGITHTVWAALGLGGTLAVGGGFVARLSGRTLRDVAPFTFALGTGSVLTHLAGDLLTPMGIRPLYPFVSTAYSLDLVAARNPQANLALLCAGLLVFALALRGEWTGWAPRVRTRLAARTGRPAGPPTPDLTPIDDPSTK